MNATNLDATLRRMGVETLVLAGVSTNVAIAGNTMTAIDPRYHMAIPEDCIAGADAQTRETLVKPPCAIPKLLTWCGSMRIAVHISKSPSSFATF